MAEPMPRAEVRVDEALVGRLLAEQHPDLATLPVARFTHGWDNELHRLGGDLLVRLPRRRAAAELVRHEQRWLPLLAPWLPLPVPVPLRLGVPGAGYPWHWSVTPYLSGRATPSPDDLDQLRVASQLAAFLGRLHRPAPPDAPVNHFRGVPLARREEVFGRTLADARHLVSTAHASAVWQDALAAPAWSGPPVWLHGDLHPANLLADGGRLTGVLDFGDVTAGDPACDLAVPWMVLDPDRHEAFWTAYAGHRRHPDDAGLRRRARGWALALGLVLLTRSADAPAMTAIGARTVEAVLDG